MKYLLLIITLVFTVNANASFYDNELLRLTNAERAYYGLPALTFNATLGTAAQLHAEDMAANSYLEHTGLNGSTPASRATNAGYDYLYIGENIAAGYQTPEEVVDAWMNSEGHRANILNSNYTEIGFGYAYQYNDYYGSYWVQLFGQSQNTPTVVESVSTLDKANALFNRIEYDFDFIPDTNSIVSGSGYDAVYYRMYFNYEVALVVYQETFFLGEYDYWYGWEFTALSTLEEANYIFCDGYCWDGDFLW